MRSTLLAALATVSLVGCVGGITTDPTDPLQMPGDGDGNDNGDNPTGNNLAAAKQLFDTGVYPTIAMKCTGTACHSESAVGTTLTRFVATDATKGWQVATNYTAVVGNFAASAAPILTKIKGGTHQGGVTFTTAEEAKITEWLNKEVELRNVATGTPPPPPGSESLSQATERVLSQFAGCMTITNFQTANMAQAWGTLNASNNQQCENCHATGGEGFIASQDQTLFYNVVSKKKYFFLQYLTVDLTMGAAAAKVIPNTVSFKGVAEGLDPHREHPRFTPTNNQGTQALKTFYDATMLRKTNNMCDPPRALENF